MHITVWTRKDRRIAEDSDCLICGDRYGIAAGERRAHRPATCKACGTRQCWTHGIGRGQCGVCLIGLLDAFGNDRHKCGYKGCQNTAVSAAARVGFACVDHLDKPFQSKRAYRDAKTTREFIADRLAERASNWEEITFEWDAIPVLGAKQEISA